MGTFAIVVWVALCVCLAVCWQATYQRKPNLVIGSPADPYLLRWFVIPNNRFFNIYRHEILRSDDDRALHDHRAFNVSVILRGGYWEILPVRMPTAPDPVPPTIRLWRAPLTIHGRRGSTPHRLEVDPGVAAHTVFIKGPDYREWGFWCAHGWRHWTKFVSPTNSGEVGPGCG